MKYPTISALCEGIANAIREVEGSTDKINPQDFPARIAALQVGGDDAPDGYEVLMASDGAIEATDGVIYVKN